MSNNVEKEYKRLKELFAGVDVLKEELVDELIRKSAFLKVEMDRLEEIIKTSKMVQISNKGNQRINPAYKAYLQSLSTYQSIIKTLNAILGKNVEDTDDDFDDFLKQTNT